MDNRSYRDVIINQLRERNKKQSDAFNSLISLNNRLADSVETVKNENLALQVEVTKLKVENQDLAELAKSGGGGKSKDGSKNQKALEQTVMTLQENLKNAQQIIDLKNSVQEKEREILEKNTKITDLESKIEKLELSKLEMTQELERFKAANTVLQDEQNALNMAFVSLEGKFRKAQEDNNELVSRWMQHKASAADHLNAENDKIMKVKHLQLKKELADASEEFKDIQETPIPGEFAARAACACVSIPNKAMQSFEAHDGEVNAVKWSPSGRLFATGGSDRKLKLWEVVNGKCETKGILSGSNAAIMSVDFDFEEKHILAASNDFASRVWTLSDQRLRHTLTGHSGKVLTAKFMGECRRVASGSHDRTIKIWDLSSKACIKTIFAGSICFDLVTVDYNNIISGHFDRRVRFWDTRTDSSSNEISLQGRVTALDLSFDKNTLLCCSREDTVKLIDLRKNAVCATLSADGFRVGADWTRAVFSPNGEFVMAGSSDGTVYIWNVAKNRVEKALREHNHAVMACSWNPNGQSLLTCDKQKQVVYWADF
ncbi:hypothetical protein CAPTEDRAFT_224280 [Capitella teleta]|uniref:Autophagy-related protein 16 domain-containing protein n=1 Tax=Capitella teleta TaxID=283909 RepID=R7U360_CAPTE|nr:hypothetical protein CAPTEDRAFT_224280 [Capitella teleta]|eukprot:ELT97615.1 hypothetical protein CAPTEDRAFT_224280 [Capitella teleta]